MTAAHLLLERLHRLGAELTVIRMGGVPMLRWLTFPRGHSLEETWQLVRPALDELLQVLDVPRCRHCRATAPVHGARCDACELSRRQAVAGYTFRDGLGHLVRQDGTLLCRPRMAALSVIPSVWLQAPPWLCSLCREKRDHRRVQLRPVPRIPRDAWRRP